MYVSYTHAVLMRDVGLHVDGALTLQMCMHELPADDWMDGAYSRATSGSDWCVAV